MITPIRLLGTLLLFLTTFITQAATFDSFEFFYVNGVDNAKKEAEESAENLKAKILPELGPHQVGSLYQRNGGTLYQLLETDKLLYVDTARSGFKEFWVYLTLMKGSPPGFLTKVYTDVLAKYDEYTYTHGNGANDLRGMTDAVVGELNAGKKIILVSHSEGNFFANQVVNYITTNKPDLAPCLKQVAVASPATNVASHGPWTTLSNDNVINTARIGFAWGSLILRPEPAGALPTLDPPQNHNFINAYLFNFRPRLRDQIETIAAAINDGHSGGCAAGDTPVTIWFPAVSGQTCYGSNAQLKIDNVYHPFNGDSASGTVILARGKHNMTTTSLNCTGDYRCASDGRWHLSYTDRAGQKQTSSLPSDPLSAGCPLVDHPFTIN